MSFSKKINSFVKHFFRVYEDNAAYILPMSIFIILFFLMDRIPYLNLQAPLFSALLFFFPILIYWIRQNWQVKTMFFTFLFLTFFSLILQISSFNLQSEALGTVFYLLLICVTLKYIYEEATK